MLASERSSVAKSTRPRRGRCERGTLSAEPSHVPHGPALLAMALSELARGVRGLDVLRRSVDRAPPYLT